MCNRTTFLSTLFLLTAVLSSNGYAQPNPGKPDAEAILKKVRETYTNLRGYHFEHTLVVEEIQEGQKPANIAEVTLVTASEMPAGPPREFEGQRPVDEWGDAQKAKQVPHNLERCRLEVRYRRGDMVLASDGKTSWMFVGETNEFKKGERFLDVVGPTAGTMYSVLHFIPLMKFMNESLQSPKIIREEEIDVGHERKACYVLECIDKAPLLPLPPGEEPPETLKGRNPLAGATAVLMHLQIHGLVDFKRGMYLPPSDKAELPRMTLWVDAQDSIVWRTRLVEKTQRASFEALEDKAEGEPVEVQVTDNFSVAKINARLPDELFQFTPPEDAKEVRQFTQREPAEEKKPE